MKRNTSPTPQLAAEPSNSLPQKSYCGQEHGRTKNVFIDIIKLLALCWNNTNISRVTAFRLSAEYTNLSSQAETSPRLAILCPKARLDYLAWARHPKILLVQP